MERSATGFRRTNKTTRPFISDPNLAEERSDSQSSNEKEDVMEEEVKLSDNPEQLLTAIKLIDEIHPLQSKMTFADVFPLIMRVKRAMGWDSFNDLKTELREDYKSKHKGHQHLHDKNDDGSVSPSSPSRQSSLLKTQMFKSQVNTRLKPMISPRNGLRRSEIKSPRASSPLHRSPDYCDKQEDSFDEADSF